MRTTARLSPVLFATLIALTGCSARTVPPGNPMAERAAFVENRASELIKRGAPKDKAVTQASGEWENRLGAAESRSDEAQRFAQRKLEADLAKMSRNGDFR